MCVIVDNNVIARVLCAHNDPDFGPVHAALFGSGGIIAKLAYGGTKLKQEYFRNDSVRRLLVQLDRAGRTVGGADREIDQEMTRLIELGLCTSDDEHIIAIARVQQVRLLCSLDQALHEDFTNKALVDRPRGKVYQSRGHVKLLRQACAVA